MKIAAMRTFLLLITALLLHGLSAQGVVNILNGSGQTVNGTLVSHGALQSTDTVKLLTRLSGSQSRQINVRRYELWSVPGTQNFYCWGVCYLPVNAGVNSTWVSQHYVDMNPGATYNNFAAYHMANGLSGNAARFRFVFFDTADPFAADSSWVDIEFGGTVGVNERPGSLQKFTVVPNPSAGQDVWIEHGLDRWENGTELVLYDLLGARLQRIPFLGTEGRTLLRTQGLSAGVYFANVERRGRVLGTRRVVITP